MTLEFKPQNLPWPSGVTDSLNAVIGNFNETTDALNARQRRAYTEIDICDGEFVNNFMEMAHRLHTAIMAVPLEDDEDREEIFETARAVLEDEVGNFVHGNMSYDLKFDESGFNLDWWEASTC